MPADILAGLNPEQRDAVLHLDSPLLIVAGAGSGKTRVITHKIAHLVLEQGLAPQQVLAVTFTNKAAGEMKVRVEALTGIEARLFPISTFHALGLRILRESGGVLGFDSQWQVIDDDEQRRLVERLLKEKYPHLAKEGDALIRKIGLAKMGLHYPNNGEFLRQKGFSAEEIAVFAHYHAAQQQNKFWDYEDLISFAVILLRDHDEARAKFQRRFRYLLVDEFQDTNPNQYELIKLLSHDRASITVVGDDDQAIYSWRGASVRFLFDFERDFPGGRVIKLEQNYRSTPEILEFANRLISQNTLRKSKRMWSDTESSHPVFVLRSRSKEEEAEEIARLIHHLKQGNPGLFPLAILYRINSQSLALETEFIKQRISFRILKGLRFFERKEIRDALALLRLALNPADDLAFLRVVEFLPLGVGERTLETLRALARERSLPLFAALEAHLGEKFAAKPLFPLLRDLGRQQENPAVSEILARLLQASGYLETLEEKGEEERLLNLAELQEFIAKWREENPGAPFSDLLDRMTLETREGRGVEKTQVFLLTMHNAKGLEFPTVVVSGVNSAYMPFFLRKERDEIEEERRLFYVASTRASQLLVISTASDRPSFFLQQVASASYLPVYSFREIVDGIFPVAPAPAAAKGDGRFIVHPIFGRGRIVEKIAASKYLIHFSDKGEKLIDTSVVKVEFV
ncbi:MAG: ATP-dependent helicase, partial [Acidobacteria bacterium]|jgi:DNA helicase-2/ATP-dependent DNA helicase PcrA|nr:ATP-dependent helicase [Acidobacteriota bacterium]